MPFKINLSDKGKTFSLEADTESLVGRKIGEKIPGDELKSELQGYELEITGTSDIAGFPGKKDVEGTGIKRVLLTRGFGFHKLKIKKKNAIRKPISKGMRKRRTLRGNAVTPDVVQINLKVLKHGSKPVAELLAKAVAVEAAAEKSA